MNQYQEIENKLHTAKNLDDIALVLERLLSGGFSVWQDGSLYNIKQLVDRVNGLKIEIYTREHYPPHFHVKGGGIDASFLIDNCSLLEGQVGHRELALIKWWHKRSRQHLVSFWNQTRPTEHIK